MTGPKQRQLRRPLSILIFLPLMAASGLFCAGCGQSALKFPGSDYRIQPQKLDDWQSYGGAWEAGNGLIHNNSDERGAKLLTGSVDWSDYTLRADIKLDGDHGDMGITLRSSNEEEGVDAYNGYYIGLRIGDGTLVAGRSDYGWMEARPVAMPGGVRPSVWYRLTVTAVGCGIAASAQNLSTLQTSWIVLTEQPCVQTGRIGLRSVGTGGMWRNISVSPATYKDYENLASHASGVEQPEFPKREADYNRFFFFQFPSQGNAPGQSQAQPAQPSGAEARISDLQNLLRTEETPVVVRGVVTLTAPQLYIEDSSGGALVGGSQIPPLNVGDTVEADGLAQPALYSAAITQAKVRHLWSGTPVPPISVTAMQAASGAYAARFIELEGHLTGTEHDSSGREALDLDEDGQPFKAIYWNPPSKNLQKGSYLRLRGVCVLDHAYTQEVTPFALLLRSEDDIQVLAGPPWWTPPHVIMLFASLLALALLTQVAYFRIQQWKTLAITEERERLAHEIHDTMAQSFAGVGYQIQGIRSSVVRGESLDPSQIASQLNVAYHLVRRSHEEASQTIAMLGNSSSQASPGLLRELEQTAKRIAGDQVKTITETSGTPVTLNLRLANALLQIGNEAIANALRHASPTIVRLSLDFAADMVQLKVADNGSGFDYAPAQAGFGILGMQKRAREISAELTIMSSPGAGTEVKVTSSLQRTRLRKRLIAQAKTAFVRAMPSRFSLEK